MNNLIVDTDEIKLVPTDGKWSFEYRFRNSSQRTTDGRLYDTSKECLALAMVNMALENK